MLNTTIRRVYDRQGRIMSTRILPHRRYIRLNLGAIPNN
jgi:hypothetical protein